MHDTTLPLHPRTGLRALGWRRARPGEDPAELYPIWPVLGGAPDGGDEGGDDEGNDSDDGGDPADDGGDGGDGTDDDGDPEGADQLRDAGKKALDSMKGRYRSERERRKAAEAEVARLKAGTPAQGDGGEEGPDPEQIREEARREARADALRERALDRLEARAARTFADPEDARAHLAGRVEDFIDGDRIDTEAITEALEDLLTSKPYLKAEQARMAERRFKDGGDGGARPGASPQGQVTREQLAGMTTAQINEARKAGRLNSLLGRK